MVLLAGCSGGLSGAPTDDGDAGPQSAGTGTVTFYISDQPAAIEDFEHLNVTITKVGFQQAGSGDDAEERDDETNETAVPEDDEKDGADAEVGTAPPSTATTDPVTETPESEPSEDETPDLDEDDAKDDDDDGESGGWVEYEVDNRVADLTELRGANATMIDRFDLPNGTYNKVFVHVSDVNATLTTGEQVNVKLPSSKLQINERFTLENGSEVDFVFDIAVHKAGNSGKYILRPVISESGTDVPIRDVDADDDDDREDDEREDERESSLNATFVGDVAPGGNATVEVTSEGESVADAQVFVNGERVGKTDTDGRLTFEVPDGEELAVKIRSGEAEAELEMEFESDESEATPTASA